MLPGDDAASTCRRSRSSCCSTGIAERYGYDFRDYARASLTRRVRQAMQARSCRRVSALQSQAAARPSRDGALRRARCRCTSPRCFATPTSTRRCARDVIPLLRTYPFVRIWHAGCSTRRGGLLAGDPAAGGGPVRSLPHLRDRHQRRGARARAQAASSRCRAMRELHARLPAGGRARRLLGVLHGRSPVRDHSPVAAAQRDLLAAQPGVRRRVQRVSPDHVPQRA